MKKFSLFLAEAERTMAAKEAEKRNLRHVGYGKYADQAGNVTHMSKLYHKRVKTCQKYSKN